MPPRFAKTTAGDHALDRHVQACFELVAQYAVHAFLRLLAWAIILVAIAGIFRRAGDGRRWRVRLSVGGTSRGAACVVIDVAHARIDIVLIAGGIAAWIAVFVTSAKGKMGVSDRVSDTLLAVIAAVVAYGIWRAWRRRAL